jgi:hypothetical protein
MDAKKIAMCNRFNFLLNITKVEIKIRTPIKKELNIAPITP